MRDQIIDSMVRTLFVLAYADAIDNHEIEGDAATGGEDWMDVAPDADPEVDREAQELASKMLDKFLVLNGGTLESLLAEWCSPESQTYARHEHDANSFGHYIAMQSLGHGVGLNDDTDDTCREWETGRFEGLIL